MTHNSTSSYHLVMTSPYKHSECLEQINNWMTTHCLQRQRRIVRDCSWVQISKKNKIVIDSDLNFNSNQKHYIFKDTCWTTWFLHLYFRLDLIPNSTLSKGNYSFAPFQYLYQTAAQLKSKFRVYSSAHPLLNWFMLKYFNVNNLTTEDTVIIFIVKVFFLLTNGTFPHS